MRGLKLPSGQETIISDTVGFISDLPHELIKAFQATLEEVREADAILHVHDIAHPDAEKQKSDVMQVLNQIGLTEETQVPIIEVCNKIDCLDSQAKTHHSNKVARSNKLIILASAKTGEGLEGLLEMLDMALSTRSKEVNVKLPWEDGKTLAWLYERGQVIKRRNGDKCVELTVKLNPIDASRLEL